NWLSRQEGLPPDQWCYRPNERGAYDQGMSIPADGLRRTGYRLPTEAEWEDACRAGAGTSRDYGRSVELLGKYAWYQANSGGRAWPGGRAIPNDLGLFDLLGNAFEWCQDRAGDYRPGRVEFIGSEIIATNIHRRLRGGAFSNRPVRVRSASGLEFGPATRNAD